MRLWRLTQRIGRLLAVVLFPALATHRSEHRIMEALDTLNAKLEELASANADLKTAVDAGNVKADALNDVVVNVVLVRLKELADAANQGGNVTAADINAVTAKVEAVLASTAATTAEVVAQTADTDATEAAVDAANAPAPAPAPAEAPPTT